MEHPQASDILMDDFPPQPPQPPQQGGAEQQPFSLPPSTEEGGVLPTLNGSDVVRGNDIFDFLPNSLEEGGGGGGGGLMEGGGDVSMGMGAETPPLHIVQQPLQSSPDTVRRSSRSTSHTSTYGSRKQEEGGGKVKTEAGVKRGSGVIQKGEEEEESRYCICNGVDDGRFMICCDKCEMWYHGECIYIPPKKVFVLFFLLLLLLLLLSLLLLLLLLLLFTPSSLLSLGKKTIFFRLSSMSRKNPGRNETKTKTKS